MVIVAGFAPTLLAVGTGRAEHDRAELAERTVFALRGFVEFGVWWGIGAYGQELAECLRRPASYETDEILSSRAMCLISDRVTYGMSALEMGKSRRRQEDKKTSDMPDFSPASDGELGNHLLRNGDMEDACRYAFTLDFTKHRIGNQN